MDEGMQEMDVGQAADAMAKAGLFAEPSTEAAPERKTPQKDPATGKFVKAAPPEPQADEPPAEGEPEPEAEPKPEAEAEDDGEEKPEQQFLKVKLDGLEQELPAEEVTKGYIRQADYTRKTTELAERRKQFEQVELPAVRQEREYYASRVQAIVEALEALAPDREPDWESASNTMTPEEFTAHYKGWKANRERVERAKGEHARVRELHEQQEGRARATRLAEQQELLEAALPELKDPEKGPMLREDLRAYAKSLRFTEEDLDGIEDHRALLLLDKARRYDESLKRRPTVEAKVQRAVEGLKPSGARPPAKAKEVELTRKRLLETGSVEDAAAAMKAAKIFG